MQREGSVRGIFYPRHVAMYILVVPQKQKSVSTQHNSSSSRSQRSSTGYGAHDTGQCVGLQHVDALQGRAVVSGLDCPCVLVMVFPSLYPMFPSS